MSITGTLVNVPTTAGIIIPTGRCGDGGCRCILVVAGDGHVFSVVAAVSAPPSVRTFIETSLTASALDVVQQNASGTGHVDVA